MIISPRSRRPRDGRRREAPVRPVMTCRDRPELPDPPEKVPAPTPPPVHLPVVFPEPGGIRRRIVYPRATASALPVRSPRDRLDPPFAPAAFWYPRTAVPSAETCPGQGRPIKPWERARTGIRRWPTSYRLAGSCRSSRSFERGGIAPSR